MTASTDPERHVHQPIPGTRTCVCGFCTSDGHHFGEAVRVARESVRLTQQGLGQLIGYSRSAVSRLESSSDPRLTPATLSRIGEVLSIPVAHLLGQLATDQEDTVNRRQLLAAATSGAVFASTSDRVQVDPRDVRNLEQGIKDLREIDQQSGGDRLGYFAQQLVAAAEQMLQGSYRLDVATHLYGVLGEACVLSGWLAQDASQLVRAQKSYADALAAAQLAHDPLLAAHAYANLSLLSLSQRQPQKSLEYAQAGQRSAARRGGSRLRALLFAREATGHAELGDTSFASQAMGQAVDAFHSGQGEDPAWVAFLSEAELAGILGDVYSRSGAHRRAVDQMRLAAQVSGRPRNAASWRIALAWEHAEAGDPAQAAVVAAPELNSIDNLTSQRVRGNALALVRRLKPFSAISEVAAFQDKARAFGLVA